MGQLDQKVVAITGGNQGIGKGIAKLFGSEGARLALCARNATKLAATAAELRALGYDVLERQTDVSSEPAVESFFSAVMERFGRVDIMVNNAGNFDGGRIDTVTMAEWNNVIGAALTGAFLCSRAAFRIMKEQGGADPQYRLDLRSAASGGQCALHVRQVRTVGPHERRRTGRPTVRNPLQLPAPRERPRRMAGRPASCGQPGTDDGNRNDRPGGHCHGHVASGRQLSRSDRAAQGPAVSRSRVT